MVPGAGIEPTRPSGHGILSPSKPPTPFLQNPSKFLTSRWLRPFGELSLEPLESLESVGDGINNGIKFMATDPTPVGPDFFAEPWWTDDAIAAWLASFIDHAGRIVCSTAVVITIETSDPYVLRAIQRRFPYGEIETPPAPRRPYVWRITNPTQVRRVIGTVLRFLTTNHGSACDALERLDAQAREQQARAQRDREIVAAWIAGRSHASIARAFAVSINTVAAVIDRYQRGPVIPDEPAQGRVQ